MKSDGRFDARFRFSTLVHLAKCKTQSSTLGLDISRKIVYRIIFIDVGFVACNSERGLRCWETVGRWR
jgi:hypothetical protein